MTNYDPVEMHDGYFGVDTVTLKSGAKVYEDPEHYIRLDLLDECNHIEPGSLYSADAVNRTYRALGRLNVLKQINIDVRPVGEVDGVLMVDAFVLLQPDKTQTVSVSLEGTNREGDLGFGVGLDYEHRNIFKGAEVFNAKARVSYESISGNVSGLINNNYSEYSTELGITFPKFMAPLLKRSFKRKIQASTIFSVNFDYQARPEFTRVIAGGGWRYQWSEPSRRMSHTLTLVDLSFISVPKKSEEFKKRIINPLLSYSYEDHLIMRMGYNFYRTNKALMSVQRWDCSSVTCSPFAHRSRPPATCSTVCLTSLAKSLMRMGPTRRWASVTRSMSRPKPTMPLPITSTVVRASPSMWEQASPSPMATATSCRSRNASTAVAPTACAVGACAP